MIVPTYYGFVWSVCCFNMIKCIVGTLVEDNEMGSTILWLITRFIIIFVEVCVVVFMAHGHMASGREDLNRTAWITTLIAAIYTGVQVLLLYQFNIKLYYHDQSSSLYWFILSSIFVCVYLILLLLPYTRCKERFPVRPGFYRYVFLLYLLNFLQCLGSFLQLIQAGFGYCFIDLSEIMYYSFFAPVLYFSFLRDFFREAALPDYVLELHDDDEDGEPERYFDTDT